MAKAWWADPTRRVFVGVGLALAVGFVPAALFARGPGMRRVRELRDAQAALSAQPATHEVTAAFFELEDEVDGAFRRDAALTLALWLGAAGAAGLVFRRVTARRP